MFVILSFLVLPIENAGAHTPHDVIEDVVVSSKFAEDGTVYAISRTLLLKSTDRGLSWSKLSIGLDVKGPLESLGISAQDPETVYAAGWGSGVYRSRDGGTTWSNVMGNIGKRPVLSVAVSPWNDDLVFATGKDGSPAWVTSTGGTTWRRIGELEQVTSIAFAKDVRGLVLAGDQLGAVHVSDDSGATWSTLPFHADDGGGIRSIAVSPSFASDHTFFVGTQHAGVYGSTDGGASFARTSEGLADPATISLAISPSFETDGTLWVSTFSDGVFVTRDRGQTWASSSDGLTTNEQADQLKRSQFGDLRVARTSDGTSTLFLGAFDGLFRSLNGGASWHELQTQRASIIMGLAVSPAYANDRTLFLSTYINGLFRSQDDGATWTATNSGVVSDYDWGRSRYYVNRLFPMAVSPTYASDHTVFAVARGSIFRSTDAGSHWREVVPTGAIVEGEFPPDYFFLGLSPDFAIDGTILVGTDGGKIFISTDSGKSYTRLGDLGLEVTSLVMSPAFARDSTAYVGTPDGVFRTNDRGASWVATAWPFGAGSETSLAISPAYGSRPTLFAGSANGLLVTSDGGASWRRASTDEPLATGTINAVAISPNYAKDGTVLVSAEGRGLYRSTDGGTTWHATGKDLLAHRHLVLSNFYHATSEPIVFSPDYAHDRTVFGFDLTSLLRSTDGGTTWDKIDRPVTVHRTTEASAPGPRRSTPRLAASGSPLTARKVAFAAVCAALSVLVLWITERVGGRWRWLPRIAIPLAVFGGVLWLLQRR